MIPVFALFGGAAASFYANKTATAPFSTKYVTVPCTGPTTLTHQGSTLTVSEATTLTLEDCECTDMPTSAPASAAPVNQTAPSVATKTDLATKFTTIPCSSPTVLTHQGSTYTVTEPTTLTLEDCECTEMPKTSSAPSSSSPNVAPAASTPVESPVTQTQQLTKFTTIPCTSPTTLTHESSTLTISQPTTLTLPCEECGKTSSPSAHPTASSSPSNSNPGVQPVNGTSTPSTPELANGGNMAQVGSAVGMVAAVALLI